MTKTKFLILTFILTAKMLCAQQSYVGEIRLFAGNFPPNGWMYCDGQLLSISEYDTLFQLIGTTYGGDGQSTFALPDLRSRVPVGQGGSLLNNLQVGGITGQEQFTLNSSSLPAHTHNAQIMVSDQRATQAVPTTSSSISTTGIVSGRSFRPNASYNNLLPDVLIDSFTTGSAGGNQPVNLIKPFQAINYIISMYGIYPTQN